MYKENSQSTITGITLFPDEDLFILALYFTLLQQPIFIRCTFSSAYYFGLFCEVMFMISLYTSNFCGTDVQHENSKAEFDVHVFTVSFFLMYIFLHQYMAHYNQETK